MYYGLVPSTGELLGPFENPMDRREAIETAESRATSDIGEHLADIKKYDWWRNDQ